VLRRQSREEYRELGNWKPSISQQRIIDLFHDDKIRIPIQFRKKRSYQNQNLLDTSRVEHASPLFLVKSNWTYWTNRTILQYCRLLKIILLLEANRKAHSSLVIITFLQSINLIRRTALTMGILGSEMQKSRSYLNSINNEYRQKNLDRYKRALSDVSQFPSFVHNLERYTMILPHCLKSCICESNPQMYVLS